MLSINILAYVYWHEKGIISATRRDYPVLWVDVASVAFFPFHFNSFYYSSKTFSLQKNVKMQWIKGKRMLLIVRGLHFGLYLHIYLNF